MVRYSENSARDRARSAKPSWYPALPDRLHSDSSGAALARFAHIDSFSNRESAVLRCAHLPCPETDLKVQRLFLEALRQEMLRNSRARIDHHDAYTKDRIVRPSAHPRQGVPSLLPRDFEGLPVPSLRPRMRLVIHRQHMLHRKLRVALGRSQPLVPEQFLDRPQVCTFLQHVRAESVSQRMWMHIR